MTISSLLDDPLYTAGALDDSSPWKFHVALNGHPYMLDLTLQGFRQVGDFAHTSIALLRAQNDSSTRPAEASINPEDLWRRGVDDWSLGAGQTFYDRAESDPRRFNVSKGIDIWTRYQIALLKDTDQKVSSAGTNLALCPAGARLYLIDGTAVKYTTDVSVDTPTLSTVTSTGASSKLSIASDGTEVRFTDGADVYTTNTGTGAASVYNTLDCTLLAYVKGRWMAANGAAIYNITSGSVPSALFTQAQTSFAWVGFASGQNAIYCAGFSGDKSLIYRIAIRQDATSLDQPVVAGELPDGEIVRSIGGYLGFILLGTDKGWRFCIPNSDGSLRIGHNVPTAAAVRCFEGQDRFVWYGNTNYDGTSTGLGRMDVSTFGDTERQQPAYTSDLMVTGQGNVLDVCTFQSLRVFAVSGLGIYAETTNLVSTATLDSGQIGYGLPELKVAVNARVRFLSSFAGTMKMSLASNGSSTFTLVGTHADTSSDVSGDSFTLGQRTAETFETRIELDRSSGTPTTGPTLTRWVMRSQPAAANTYKITWPVILSEREMVDGSEEYMDPAAELAQIKEWHTTREVLTAQESNQQYQVMIDDFDWRPTQPENDWSAWNGVCFLNLKVVG